MDRVGCNGIRWERDSRGIGSMGLSVGEERGRGEEEGCDWKYWEDAYVKVLLWITHNKNLSIS